MSRYGRHAGQVHVASTRSRTPHETLKHQLASFALAFAQRSLASGALLFHATGTGCADAAAIAADASSLTTLEPEAAAPPSAGE